MTEWRETTLGDVIEVSHGFAFKGEFFSEGGDARLVTPGNFFEAGGFRDRGDQQKTYDGPIPGLHVLEPGEIVVAMTEQASGLLGSSGLVPSTGRWLHNQRIGRVHIRDRSTSKRFIYYLFNSPGVRAQIAATATGAKVRHTAAERILAVKTLLPGPRAQARIAAVLAAFDELIAINERRIELLEDLARSLYREWFVRFRFPSADRVPANGAVLEGWTRVTLGTVTLQLSRGIAPRYAYDGEWTVINQRCIRNGRVSLAPARNQSRPVADAKRLRRTDILVNSTGVGTLGRVAILFGDGARVTADSHVTIIRAQEQVMQVWLGVSLLERQDELAGMGAGSTGQTELGRDRLGALPVVLPSRPVLQQFSEAVGPLLETAHSLGTYNERLTATRDLLLPRLVTGRLDISDVDLGDLLPAETAA